MLACALFRDASVDPREKVPFHAKFPVLEKDFDFLGGAHDPVYEVRKVELCIFLTKMQKSKSYLSQI